MVTIKKFWADWCAPCRAYTPIVNKVVEGRDDVTLEEIDIEEFPEVASKYEVRGVPFTVFEGEDGTVLGGFSGPTTAAKLNKLIDNFVNT